MGGGVEAEVKDQDVVIGDERAAEGLVVGSVFNRSRYPVG
jgi:hypothetical protein